MLTPTTSVLCLMIGDILVSTLQEFGVVEGTIENKRYKTVTVI